MKNKRLWSLGLTGVLAVSVCGCGGSTEPAEETVQAVEIAEEAVKRSGGKDTEKEETVYVNADANGKVENIIVSSWLKNSKGASEITDVTNLTDVVNVKGDEPYTQDGDTYVWEAKGNDIYYQGGTSDPLPVDVKVTYYLDGQEIAPDELAGKSGKVKIRFDYTNLTSEQVDIGGEKTEIFVPFVAASTLVLDSDKFVNVEVENGKILSDGKNTIVVGVAMPGLYESLDLMNLEGFEDVDIPEYVEVTADVTEFELAMTATVLMPDVFSEMDTDDMDGFDDLKDDIEELNDATYELIDGCVELDDGVQELKDNMPDLWDGAVELDDGAVELDDGAQELMDGADKLNDGAKDIRDGAGALDDGVGTLQSGVETLDDGISSFSGGIGALAEGLQAIQNPMMLGPDGKSGNADNPYIKSSIGLLKNGVDTLVTGVSGMGSALEKAIKENQTKMQTAYSGVVVLTGNLQKSVAEAQELERQLTELARQMGLISSESSTSPEKENSENEGLETEAEEISEPAQGESVSETEEMPEETTEETLTDMFDGEAEEPTDAVAEEPAKEPTDAVSEEPAEEPTDAVAEEPAEEPTDAVAEEPAEEPSDAVSEETPEEPEEEQSEFAESYLEGLSEPDGMTSMGMVQTADQGQGTGISNPEAVMEGYRKVVELQTKLIGKLNEITDLQNQLREAATNYAGLAGADTALKQLAGQLNAGANAEQLTQLTEGMAALESSIGQIYDGITLINSQMGTLIGGTEELSHGVRTLKDGAASLKDGTEQLYQGGIDLREGSKELYEGTQDLKDGTEELKDGTQELKDGVIDLIDGVDDLKDGTEELLDGVYEYNDDGIQKLYDTVNVDLQNLLDRVDAVADLSEAYQSFSGKSDAMEGSVKFIIETEAIEMDEE